MTNITNDLYDINRFKHQYINIISVLKDGEYKLLGYLVNGREKYIILPIL